MMLFLLLEKVLSDMIFKIVIPLVNICTASGNGDLILHPVTEDMLLSQ